MFHHYSSSTIYQRFEYCSHITSKFELALLYLCVSPSTSPYSVSKSWGGDNPTSDRDQSWPRPRHYLYNFKSIPPAGPVSTVFLDSSSSLLHPIAPPSAVVYCCIPLCVLHTTPISYTRLKCRPPGHWPHPTPSSLRCSSQYHVSTFNFIY